MTWGDAQGAPVPPTAGWAAHGMAFHSWEKVFD